MFWHKTHSWPKQKKGVFLRLQKDSDRLSISLIVFDKTSPQKKNN